VPLGGTHSEDVALGLLEAGADLSSLSNDGYSFRKYAISKGWYRVLDWLDKHGS